MVSLSGSGAQASRKTQKSQEKEMLAKASRSPRLRGNDASAAAIDPDEEIVARLRRDKAIQEIESSGFSQASFSSSASAKVAQIALPGESQGVELMFGTAVEKLAANAKPTSAVGMADDDLCHPNLFGDEAKREEDWIKYLFQLRRKLMKVQE